MPLFFHSTNTKAQCDTLIETHKYNISAGQKERLHIFEVSSIKLRLNTHHFSLRWCFHSTFFWLICRGHIKNAFNVLCLLWESLVTIDSWRDSFLLRGIFLSPLQRRPWCHHQRRARVTGDQQSLTAVCSWKTCQIVGILKILVYPVFFPAFTFFFRLPWC